MTDTSLEDGIAAYAREQRELLEYLSDWRNQDEFDHHFSHEILLKPTSASVLTEGSFMLGTMSGGNRDWWLHLAQIMLQLGLIDGKHEGGKVWY